MNNRFKLLQCSICLFLSVGISTGCASLHGNHQTVVAPELDRIFDHTAFKTSHLAPIETEEEIFALPQEAKLFIHKQTHFAEDTQQKIMALIDGIFDRSKLNLTYANEVTTTASQTYRDGVGNCISMTIMAYSMMRQLGVHTEFIDVDVPEFWTRREGYNLINGHVNLRVSTQFQTQFFNALSTTITVDFEPREYRRHFKHKAISKQQIMALFYNNRAAEALVSGRLNKAYQYLWAVAQHDPTLSGLYGNLGVLYRLGGNYHRAEQAYQYALLLEEDNYTAMENLAMLYRRQDRIKDARALETKVANARHNNPFYHFILGEEARDNDKFDVALGHYNRAIALDDQNHKILFAMSQTHYELGNTNKAKRFLSMAARQSENEREKQRYRSKLSLLHNEIKRRQVL